MEGKTPEISIEQARKRLRSIDVATVIGLRDRAVLGVLAYTGARIGEDAKTAPLFRSAVEKKRLTLSAYPAHSMRRMLKRRLTDAGLPELFSPHRFRVAVVTDLLKQDVPLEDVQYLAGHSNPKTTQIYDRGRRKVTRNIVERISI